MSKTAADYAVIRFVPDLARHEVFNLGLVAWNTRDWVLRLDDEASKRIIRQNPHLASSIFSHLETELREKLASIDKIEPQTILDTVRSLGLPQMTVGDPLFFAVPSASYKDLSTRVDDLVKRIITPRKIGGGSSEVLPVAELQAAFNKWIKEKRIQKAYFVQGHTGVRRTVDFYINGGSNIALDGLKLNVKNADEIIGRADREANKVRDVLGTDHVSRFIVYCRISEDKDLEQASTDARSIILDSGAAVVTVLDDAVRHMRELVQV